MKINMSKLKKSAAISLVLMLLFNVLYNFSVFATELSSSIRLYVKINDEEVPINNEVDSKINVNSGDKVEFKIEYIENYFNIGDKVKFLIPKSFEDSKIKYAEEDELIDIAVDENNNFILSMEDEEKINKQGCIYLITTVGAITDNRESNFNVITNSDELNVVINEENSEGIPVEDKVSEVESAIQDKANGEQQDVVENEVAVDEETDSEDEMESDESTEVVAVGTETQSEEIDISNVDGIAIGVIDNSKIIEEPYVARNGFNINGITTVAFDFHIFSNEATLNAHTNGNIATKSLNGNGQGFGTNQDNHIGLNEDNYIANNANSITGNIASNGKIVIGNDISVEVVDNGKSVIIGSGSNKLDPTKSRNVYKQINGREQYININNEFGKLRAISNELASKEASTGVILSEVSGENQSITVKPIEGVYNYYLNVKATEICDGSNKRILNISIPEGITLIINVDMAGVSQDYLSKLVTTINSAENSEGNIETENNVLWNLRNGESTFTTNGLAEVGCSDWFMGTILAPDANIQYGALNGSVIANSTMQNHQESHKWTFTGHDKENPEVEIEIKPTKISLEGSKKLKGKDLVEGMFNFVVLEGENQVATGKNDSEGKIVFSEIEYSEEGTHEYTVKEVNGDVDGVTYDVSEYKITVKVVAGEDGQLVATAAYPESGVVFINKYEEAKVESVKASITAKKVLEGKELTEGMFKFELLNSKGEKLQEVSNDAQGNITFTEIEYNEAGDYVYKVKEVAGTDVGITYDTTEYEVTVKVAESEGNKLGVEVITQEGGIVFNNKYEEAKVEIKPTAVVLEATKKLEGKKLETDMFSFEVINKDNKIVSTAKNDSTGTIMFNLINYDKAGTYEYTVREVKGSLEGIVYDTTTFKVTINVEDNGQGQLVAKITYPKDGIVFKNTYKEPVAILNPKTGDWGIGIVVGIMAIAAIGLIVINRKKKEK